MPFELNISQTEEVAYISGTGQISLQSCLSQVSSLAIHPDFQSHYGVLVDLTDTCYAPSKMEMQRFGGFLGHLKDAYQGKVAIVSGRRDAFWIGIVCHLARKSGWRVESFSDINEARQYVMAGKGDLTPSDAPR